MSGLGLVGRKVGMTRIFMDDGRSVPVTVLDVSGNRVAQIKTVAGEGYSAVQVAFGSKKSSSVNKAAAGHFAKAGIEAARGLLEFPVTEEQAASLVLGAQLSVEMFAEGQLVDATATSQGKGFSGAIKRHNFSSNRASHGNSVTTRAPGSIGMAQDPGRVFPGKKMAGQYGNVRRTVQNLEVVRVDIARQLLLVKGSVPGAKEGDVIIRPAVKAVV